MATREAYVRVVFPEHRVDGDTVEVIAGLEWQAGESFKRLRWLLTIHLSNALYGRDQPPAKTVEECACIVEEAIKASWPERAYFIEVGRDDDAWVQVFQPYGLPRVTL